jgi:hypothetical protein
MRTRVGKESRRAGDADRCSPKWVVQTDMLAATSMASEARPAAFKLCPRVFSMSVAPFLNLKRTRPKTMNGKLPPPSPLLPGVSWQVSWQVSRLSFVTWWLSAR